MFCQDLMSVQFLFAIGRVYDPWQTYNRYFIKNKEYKKIYIKKSKGSYKFFALLLNWYWYLLYLSLYIVHKETSISTQSVFFLGFKLGVIVYFYSTSNRQISSLAR